MKRTRKPFTCPVCEGKGIQPPGFYDVLPGLPSGPMSLEMDQCRSCSGSGIVWDTEPPRKPLAAVPRDE